jgi:hypothetical protein
LLLHKYNMLLLYCIAGVGTNHTRRAIATTQGRIRARHIVQHRCAATLAGTDTAVRECCQRVDTCNERTFGFEGYRLRPNTEKHTLAINVPEINCAVPVGADVVDRASSRLAAKAVSDSFITAAAHAENKYPTNLTTETTKL